MASFGNISASGGVYVGVAADAIVSNPGTHRVGVILRGNNLSELLQKIGVRFETVKSGAYKDPAGPRPEHGGAALLQSLIDSSYDQFVTAVAEGRKLETTKVRAADGRVFSGAQAKDLGLVMNRGMRRPREGWRHAWPISMRIAAAGDFGKPRKRLLQTCRPRLLTAGAGAELRTGAQRSAPMDASTMTDALQLRGLRGATTSSENTVQAIRDAVNELVEALMEQNDLSPQQLVSVTFSVTTDLDAVFQLPRRHRPGRDTVALLDVQQMAVQGDLARCIRLFAHAWLPATQTFIPTFAGDETAPGPIWSQLTDQRPTHSPVQRGGFSGQFTNDSRLKGRSLTRRDDPTFSLHLQKHRWNRSPDQLWRHRYHRLAAAPCSTAGVGSEHPLAAGIPLG